MTEFAEGLKESLEVVAPYMQQISEKIGEGWQFMFSLAVKNSYVTGVTYLLQCLTQVAIAFALYKTIRYINKKVECKKLDDGDRILLVATYFVAFCVVGIPTIVCFVNNVTNALPYLINPEYMALMDVISKFKQ